MHPELSAKIETGRKAQLEDILNASPDLKKQLLDAHPDRAVKFLQDNLLGQGERRNFIVSLLNKNMTSVDKLPLEDKARAFVLGIGLTQDELKQQYQNLDAKDGAKLKAAAAKHYFETYHQSLTEHVLGKVSQDDSFRDVLSFTDVTAGQVGLNIGASHDRHTSIADPLIEQFWEKSQANVDAQNRQVDAFLAKYGDKLTDDKQKEEFRQVVAKFQESQKNYFTAKEGAASAFADSTIQLATVVGTLFAPEVSLPLLAATGVAGAGYKIAITKAIAGKDFQADPASLTRYGVEGFISAAIGVAGPHTIGLKGIFTVGSKAATEVAAEVVAQKQFSHYFTVKAEETVSTKLSHLAQVDALTGSKHGQAELAKIVDEVTTAGAPKEQITAALYQVLNKNTRGMVALKLEVEQLFRSASVGTSANVAGQLVVTGAGLQSPQDLIVNLPQAAAAGALGASVFHLGFRGVGAAFKPLTMAQDHQGHLWAQKGTTIYPDKGQGRPFVAPEAYQLQSDDRVSTSSHWDLTPDHASPVSSVSHDQLPIGHTASTTDRLPTTSSSSHGHESNASDSAATSGHSSKTSGDRVSSSSERATTTDHARAAADNNTPRGELLADGSHKFIDANGNKTIFFKAGGSLKTNHNGRPVTRTFSDGTAVHFAEWGWIGNGVHVTDKSGTDITSEQSALAVLCHWKDGHAIDLLLSKDAEAVLKSIPANCQVLGAGQFGMALKEPSGAVLRIEHKPLILNEDGSIAKGSAKNRRSRSANRYMSKPAYVQRIGEYQLERLLPFRDTKGQSVEDLVKLEKNLEKTGHYFSDPKLANMGRVPGSERFEVIDPGAIKRIDKTIARESIVLKQSAAEARTASNDYTVKGRVTGRLADGFAIAGKGRLINAAGESAADWRHPSN